LENQNIEWKSKWRDEYLAWVCGFANAGGGVIEIGRDDKGVVVGLADAEIENLLEMLPNKIRNATGVLADVDAKNENRKRYIVVTVKPYPSPVTYRGRYYCRSGSTTQELTGSALEEFMLRKLGKTWDGVPVPYVKESEFNRDAFMLFRKKALESTRLTEGDLEIDDAALLSNLMLTEGKYLKRAAILLFHQTPENWVPGAYVKIGCFENDANILYQDEIHGSLIAMPDKVLDTLYLKYFKGLISYRGIQRIETYPFAKSALREAVLNAVIHKDYSTGVPIQIKVYPDKIVIYNTGGLPNGWTIQTLMSTHGSNQRNPMIAGGFFRSGMIESWGRGIGKIIESCQEEGKPSPNFDTTGADMMVTLFSNNEKSDISENGIYTDAGIGINIGIKDGINETQGKIIALITANPNITAEQISEEIGISKRNVESNISKLKKNRVIEREGARKTGRWIVKT